MNKNPQLQIYGGKWIALIPLLFFVIGAMYLGLNGSPDEYGFWPIVVSALIIALLISKNREKFIRVVIDGMSDKLVVLMILAWLLSGVIGKFMSSTGLIESIIALYLKTGLGGGFFVAAVFIIAALTGTTTGTAVGTVLIVTPVLFKAGITLGIDPYLIVGAILAGGAFGDDFSPLSDTTIAVASTQGIDIGKSVRSRLKYAATAGTLALILFFILGSLHKLTKVEFNQEVSYKPLLMLLSPTVVIIWSMRGKHIVNALLLGILTAILIALPLKLITPEQLFSLDPENFSAKSIIIDGMKKGVGISIFSIFLIGLVSFVLASGVLESFINYVTTKVKKQSIGELIIIFMTIIVNTLIAHNTITIMSLGKIVKDMSEKLKINSYRAGNILDISGNTVMHILPYMITVILATSLANQMTTEKLNPFVAGLYNFHSIFLFFVIVFVSITGIWRKADEKYLTV